MKWYLTINEDGTCTKVGWHARLAVASALAVGGLEPVLVYAGQPNGFTQWMEEQGVTILWREGRLAPVVRGIEARAPGYISYLGHWLRTNICLWEDRDEFVLYTDCDVVFLRRPELAAVRPAFIACAPEFLPQNWNYFNSGVMVLNVPALRQEYPAFERFIVEEIRAAAGPAFLDQEAYNHFYRRRWTHLDPRFNWKPYWGAGGDRLGESILHFHGPKLPELLEILSGRWSWDNPFERTIGSMMLSAYDGYLSYVRMLAAKADLFPDDVGALLAAILAAEPGFDRARYRDRVSLDWAERRMFPED